MNEYKDCELLGIPGCGKSTYANKIIQKNNYVNPLDRLLYNDSRIKQNLNKVKLCLQFAIDRPLFTLKLIRCFNHVKFRSLAKWLKCLMYVIYTLEIVEESRRQRNYVILDEGICQVIWGIMYNAQDNMSQQIKALFEKLMPFVMPNVVVLDVENSVLETRLSSRSNHGGAEIQHDILKNPAILDDARKYVARIVTMLIDCGKDVTVHKEGE